VLEQERVVDAEEAVPDAADAPAHGVRILGPMTSSISFGGSLQPLNLRRARAQGCRMVYFQTENPTLGKF
jgi:hypothetical protein